MSDLNQANCDSHDSSFVGTGSDHPVEQFNEMLKEVSDAIAPVWPLKDYVAVNPYFGIHQRTFMDARAFLKVFSDCETLMPVGYYAHQFQKSSFDRDDIAEAITELAEVGLSMALTLDEIASQLECEIAEHSTLDQPAPESNPHRCVKTIAEIATASTRLDWTEAIRDEVSKCCASTYDDGQASWQSPWRNLPLYQAWHSMARHDRSMESLGMVGFRAYVQQMPFTAEAAIVYSLERMKIPKPLWSTFLLCQAFSIPGWCAWAKYQDAQDDHPVGNDFAGLLAMRLAYDAVLSETLGMTGEWGRYMHDDAASFPVRTLVNDSVLRYVLLRASEIGFRKLLLGSVQPANAPHSEASRKLAQMVFCIDVRSERIRRQIESVSGDIETFGFAGFFAMPIAYGSIGESEKVAHLPVLLKPQFTVSEGLHDWSGSCCEQLQGLNQQVKTDRVEVRSWRKLWRGFQTSAVGCFSFVETTGAFYGFKLLRRALGWQLSVAAHRDGVPKECQHCIGPTLCGLEEQDITFERQVALAEGMLTNLGLRSHFGKLVVFCGHASQTDNNPLAAGLDCGACGGHSGEPNARFAAILLNQATIRAALSERGLAIPDDTHFLGAVHNTTTDRIEFFDLQQLPATHQGDLQQLVDCVIVASQQTQQERLPIVASPSLSDLMRRAVDWSEVRPEWGLAGNAAFIVAPRSMTKGANLNARAFLHSYDHTLDPEGKVLELIMTAPMVVANWINMQYYASTVDNHHFGSGNKTVHNVVGQFGVLSGNGGDLKTGLPWQSLHTGDDYQHLPLRLQVVIAAPRTAIEQVIEKHDVVASLITNGWMHLAAIEPDNSRYRYSAHREWALI